MFQKIYEKHVTFGGGPSKNHDMSRGGEGGQKVA